VSVDAPALDGDALLVQQLRAGDEAAFLDVVRRYERPMLALARSYVGSRARAEDIVQETWLAAIRGIDRFEGRSSFKTWLFRILVNRAKTLAVREARSVPFSAVDEDRFFGDGHQWAGHWAEPPQPFSELPEARLLARETLEQVEKAIEGLPARQRQVITLRDVEGWSASEVCEALGLSDGNQRILLHRARSVVRRELEAYLTVAPAIRT
jgi:RNA polymerase sigma-70 factor, ECF subfamily